MLMVRQSLFVVRTLPVSFLEIWHYCILDDEHIGSNGLFIGSALFLTRRPHHFYFTGRKQLKMETKRIDQVIVRAEF